MSEKDNKWEKINRVQLIEAAVASFLTLVILVIASVYAWFTLSDKMETMTKVKEPDNLDIRAGNYQPVINFDLNGINIEDMADNHHAEYRVFSVSGGYYKIAYKLQLAHTTNIPFKYTLYKATWKQDATGQNAARSYVEYHPLGNTSDISYYELGAEVELSTLNPDEENENIYGRIIGMKTGTIYGKTYEAVNDDPEIYAVPIYMQSGSITPNGNVNEPDYYVLKIEWDEEAAAVGFTQWNKAENNKETDIICITASRITN